VIKPGVGAVPAGGLGQAVDENEACCGLRDNSVGGLIMGAEVAGIKGMPSRVFRGWGVVGALFVGGFALYGGGVYSFFLFVNPLAEQFHWSYAATSSLITAFWLSGPLSLVTDRLIRHVGIKRLVLGGILIEVVGLIGFPLVSHFWEMYLLRAFAGLGKVLYIMVLPIILSKWFSRRFGIAIAMSLSGWQLGGVVFVPITRYLIQSIGWQGASAVLGLAVLVIALPPSLWMLRVESAAEMGLCLDGAPSADRVASTHSAGHDHIPAQHSGAEGSLHELLRHRGFQLVAVATLLYNLAVFGVLVLQPTTVESVGESAAVAAAALSATTIFAAVGELLSGYVIDRFSLAVATTIQYLLLGLGIITLWLFVHSTSDGLLAAHTVSFGLAMGGITPFWLPVLKRTIPERLFQRGWGIWYFIQLLCAVVAPIGAGKLYDLTGNFSVALGVELALLVGALAFTLIMMMMKGRGAQVHPEYGHE